MGGMSAALTSRNESPPVHCRPSKTLRLCQSPRFDILPRRTLKDFAQILAVGWAGECEQSLEHAAWQRGHRKGSAGVSGDSKGVMLWIGGSGACAVAIKWSWVPVTFSAGMQVDPWVLHPLRTVGSAACLAQAERRRFSKHPWDHSPTSASTDFAASNSSYLKCH